MLSSLILELCIFKKINPPFALHGLFFNFDFKNFVIFSKLLAFFFEYLLEINSRNSVQCKKIPNKKITT